MRTLRNIFRRKLRVTLTILGITIGVLALVVMGGMAEKLNGLVAGGTKYYSGKVIVRADDTGSFGGTIMPTERLDEVKAVPGVATVSASIETILDPDQGVVFGQPPIILGGEISPQDIESFNAGCAEGRMLETTDTGSVMLGSDLVKRLDAKIGGTVTVRDREYTVVGILDKTLTVPDTMVFMTLPDAQQIMADDLPEMIRAQVDPSALATSFIVYPEAGTDPELLASRIAGTVEGVEATGPKAFEEQVASSMRIFNSILYGIAIIALFVGGLSVINTMTMAVTERTREIGVRKAIGASDRQIVGQFLSESAVIGLIGGVTGLALGWITTVVADKLLAAHDIALFYVSPRLAIGSVLFAVFLGLVSGLYPSLHAARLRPVLALRYE